ncbi:cupin [Trichoderma arundinaceum]|uniref:Cupin n=1 Tax=Trichoderma arundinaceum TaxID=490622 RepID=A0A395NNP3_TRIAR|nr:cupin [Trichoderma arundinaceum]
MSKAVVNDRGSIQYFIPLNCRDKPQLTCYRNANDRSSSPTRNPSAGKVTVNRVGENEVTIKDMTKDSILMAGMMPSGPHGEEEDHSRASSGQKRRRPTKGAVQANLNAPSKKRRPSRKSLHEDTPEEVRDKSVEEEKEEDEEDVAPRKKQRTTRPAASKARPAKPKQLNKRKAPAVTRDITVSVPATSKSKPKAGPKTETKGRPRRRHKNAGAGGDAEEADAGETSFAALQRGPPMPKSRGLVSMCGDLDDKITKTRFGRHSYRPIEYWRGEQVVWEDEEQVDMFAKDRFVMPSIKEVVRVPMKEVHSRTSAAKGKARPKQMKPMVGEDYEEWKINPGTIEGEIVIWKAEYEEHPPVDDETVQVADECIAVSAKVVQGPEICGATFWFAKTLTMPFMGAGVIDLPPGGEKRPKNSRKMHMPGILLSCLRDISRAVRRYADEQRGMISTFLKPFNLHQTHRGRDYPRALLLRLHLFLSLTYRRVKGNYLAFNVPDLTTMMAECCDDPFLHSRLHCHADNLPAQAVKQLWELSSPHRTKRRALKAAAGQIEQDDL